jgi:hypothetical protein
MKAKSAAEDFPLVPEEVHRAMNLGEDVLD